jgi:hypothetical protein
MNSQAANDTNVLPASSQPIRAATTHEPGQRSLAKLPSSGLKRLEELPPDLRKRAKAQLLLKIVEHFDKSPEVTDERMLQAFGFDRQTLRQWWSDAKARHAAG